MRWDISKGEIGNAYMILNFDMKTSGAETTCETEV
jgi:hypothetical protein